MTITTERVAVTGAQLLADLRSQRADAALTGEPTRDDIVAISRAVMAAHGINRSPQGGYAAKNDKFILACDNMPNTYPEELKTPYSAATLDRMSSGQVFEDYIAERLVAEADPEQVVVIAEERGPDGERTDAGKAAKEEATWAAYLDPKVRFIFNARLSRRFSELVSEHFGRTINDPDRVSEPDAIELGPVMDNGLRAMRFVDVKWHKTTSGSSKEPKTFRMSSLAEPFFPGEDLYSGETIDLYGSLQLDDWMQLAHYYKHGEALGLVDADTSLWGAVIGKEEVLVWARLDSPMFLKTDPAVGRRRKQSPLELYNRGFTTALEVIENALARDVDPTVPALVGPEWTDKIKDSEWRDVALAELKAHGVGGHITLLPGITSLKAPAFYKADITDVGSLAALDPDSELDGVNELAPHVYQARVSMLGQVCRAPGVEVIDLPRAAIEIDFDYESDHVVYQRGVRATGRRRKPNGDFRQRVEINVFDDFTGTEDGELRVFVEMWAYFQSMIALAKARRHSIRFYHYTHFERTQDKRLAEKYAGMPGVPTLEQVEEFYASELVIDLYQVLAKQLVWPTKSHSIKDLAVHVGFAWDDETPGGAESMVWYRTAISHEDPAVREENIARLRSYNTDDTGAQVALKDWVSKLGEARNPGAKLPSVLDLRAPILPRHVA